MLRQFYLLANFGLNVQNKRLYTYALAPGLAPDLAPALALGLALVLAPALAPALAWPYSRP